MRNRPGIVTIALMAAATALVVAAPYLVSEFWTTLLIQGMIAALLAASLDLLVGYCGLPSLGHAAFYGLAGYVVAIGVVDLELDPVVATVLGVVAATAFGAAVAPVALRGRGIYFLVITLAIAQVLWGLAIKWEPVTGGFDGIPGVVRPVLLGWDLNEPRTFYYVVAIVVIAGLFALHRIVRSPLGLVLEGIRDSETRMQHLGYRTLRYQWFAFGAAAGFAGMAGVLHAFESQYVGPDMLLFTVSATALLTVILGGSGTLWGPAAVAVVLVLLEHLVSDHTERWVLVLGVLYVATVMLAPDGVLRLGRRVAARARQRSEPAAGRALAESGGGR